MVRLSILMSLMTVVTGARSAVVSVGGGMMGLGSLGVALDLVADADMFGH